MSAQECREMDTEECRQALLTRVQRVNPLGAEEIVHHIFNVLTLEKIRPYVDASDARIRTLIGKMEKTMRPRAPSPRDFPPSSWNSRGQLSENFERIQAPPAGQSGTSQLPGSSSVPDGGMRDFPDPSWNSQGQSSSTSVAVQSAHTRQTETSQLPGSLSVPDDGMRDSLDPSCNSQAQSSGTSVGIQSAQAGQIVTSQVPDDKSIGLKEHSQLSSISECSNVTGCLPSSSRQWPATCRFYISRRGLCKKGLSCDFSHGFGSSGKIEIEIRELLRMIPGAAVYVAVLPRIYFAVYKKHLPVGSDWDPRGLPSLLRPMHTICWIPGSPGGTFSAAQAYLGYSDHLLDWETLKEEDPNKIYISFSDASRSICTRINVFGYFSQYGPVMSVNIPHQRSFGLVRFQYPETVRLLLSEWNPQIPHFILGAAVCVCRYIPKPEAKLKNSAGKHGLENGRDPGIVTVKSSGTSAQEIALPLTHNQPSHSQMEIGPLEGGDATGSLYGDSADHSEPSYSQVEINPPEAGQVLDGLEINPVEGGQVPGGLGEEATYEQIADEIVPGLPDVGCFYKQT